MQQDFIPGVLALRVDLTVPVFLIYDGHKLHELHELKKLIYKNWLNQVVIICLPSKTTHKTQPLNVLAFSALQTQWQMHCRTSAIKKQHINRFNVMHEYTTIWRNTFTRDPLQKSFKVTVIYQLVPTIFPNKSSAPAQSYSCLAHVPRSFPDTDTPPGIPLGVEFVACLGLNYTYTTSNDLDTETESVTYSDTEGRQVPLFKLSKIFVNLLQFSSSDGQDTDAESNSDRTEATKSPSSSQHTGSSALLFALSNAPGPCMPVI